MRGAPRLLGADTICNSAVIRRLQGSTNLQLGISPAPQGARNMRRVIPWLTLLSLSPVARAQSAPASECPPAAAGERPSPEEWRVQAISRALGTDAAGTQRIRTTVHSYQLRFQALREAVHASMDALHRAAHDSAPDATQVDSAIATLQRAHGNLAQAEKELFIELSRGATPQQKAQLFLAFRPPPPRPPPDAPGDWHAP
jgi:hypothetical protein